MGLFLVMEFVAAALWLDNFLGQQAQVALIEPAGAVSLMVKPYLACHEG